MAPDDPVRGRVLVVGSLHWDVIVMASALPRTDETVMGKNVTYAFGGKGGNQAMSAARLGGDVAMAGRTGGDGFGDRIMEVLAGSGVDHTQVRRDDGASGMSVAIVDVKGDYGAVVVSAANQRIDPADISIPADTALVLLQNEVPATLNRAVARRARDAGARIIWNAAPAVGPDAEMLSLTDLLVVNRVEAGDMVGNGPPEIQAARLRDRGPGAVIVTLGGDGLILATDTISRCPAVPVDVVSTHGAGDTFIGAMAAWLAAGAALRDAVRFAQAAAALHVTTPADERDRISAADVATLAGLARAGPPNAPSAG